MATINSIGSNIPIELSKGGTNATSFSTSNGILKYDGTRLVSSSTATIDASNRMVNTAQPAFLATRSSNVNNVTGDTSFYVVVFNNEVFDQGNHFDGTSTFTAPVTGKYVLNGTLILGDIGTNAVGSVFNISTSNQAYFASIVNLYALSVTADGKATVAGSVLADMDAGDTATLRIQVYGGTMPKVIDVLTGSFFSGYLAC